jgi:LAS superfamily LD-carboxypeptidase LdcB
VLFVALVQTSFASPALAKKSKVQQAREQAKAVRARLAQVTAQLQAQQARSAAASQSAAAARSRLAVARVQEASVERRLNEVRASVKDAALRVYMAGVSNSGFGDIATLDPATAVRADYLRNSALGFQSDVEDQLSATRQDLELKRKIAEGAARTAADRDRAARGAVASLKASQAEQLRLVAAAEGRYQASLSEEALAARSRRIPGSRISLTTVHGITVATSIADNLDRMLNAADADGYHFGGNGYRSPEGQVAARRAHCGSSHYDVYDKPSGQCHPPTAKPGQSMHEQGLAIDFTYNGSVINSHSNAGYQWLRGHASRYGFYNLPSEAWHWSVNGN